MSWKFDYRTVRGWEVSGLFDDKGNMILGGPSLQAPTGEYKRQIEAAPEMLELLQKLVQGYSASQNAANSDATLLHLSIVARKLLEQIQNGEKDA